MPVLHKLPSPSLAWNGRMGQAQVTVDDLALVVMDYEHFRVHQAEMHTLEHIDLIVANDAYLSVLLSCNALTHVTFSVLAEGLAYAYLLENGTYSGGTVITPYNRNRSAALDGTAKALTNTYKHTPTVTVAGTAVVDGAIVPGGTSPARPSAGGRTSTEWLLAAGYDYVARVQNKSGGDAYMELNMDVYEDFHEYPGG